MFFSRNILLILSANSSRLFDETSKYDIPFILHRCSLTALSFPLPVFFIYTLNSREHIRDVYFQRLPDYTIVNKGRTRRIEKEEKYAKKIDAADQSFWYLSLY